MTNKFEQFDSIRANAFALGVERGGDLSGEWADGMTPHALYSAVAGELDPLEDWMLDELCDAYESGAAFHGDDAPNIEHMVRDALVCLLWSAGDMSPEGDGSLGNWDDTYDLGDFTADAVERMRVDVVNFLSLVGPELWGQYSAQVDKHYDYDTSGQFAHDFILTRGHHGAGFWDRGLGDLGDKLTEHAETFGEVYVYGVGADSISWE